MKLWVSYAAGGGGGGGGDGSASRGSGSNSKNSNENDDYQNSAAASSRVSVLGCCRTNIAAAALSYLVVCVFRYL